MIISRRDTLVLVSGLAISGTSTLARTPRVRPGLYDCEGCEAVSERSPTEIGSVCILAGASEPRERLVVSVYGRSADGIRPAPRQIIYAHQTNATGLYAGGRKGTVWRQRHDRLRGWIKTKTDGFNEFQTIKPAPYPNRNLPAHIHVFVKEDGKRPCYIDDIVFDGEFGVTPAHRAAQELRGGSEIVRLRRDPCSKLLARRDIRLERHP